MKTVWKILAVLTVLGVLAIGLLFGSLWIEHGREITLPAPTGTFAVGRATYDWSDDAPDPLAPVAGTKRELVVWIWYPATPDPNAPLVDYLPAPWRAAVESDRGTLISTFLTRDLAKVHAHSLRDPAVSPQQPSYPVAIMRGGASADVTNYTTLAEDLASHGYVVVGFDAPYRTSIVVFSDGRVIRRTAENNGELCEGRPDEERCADRILGGWTADTAFVLDRLARMNTSAAAGGKFMGRLDMTRVGVFGHSFGGATAAQFCSEDSRCKAGVDIDGALFGSVIRTGIRQPFMFLLGDHAGESGPEARKILANIQSIYDRLPPESRGRAEIRGGNHFLFSDDGALLKSHMVLRTLRMVGVTGIDGRRQLDVTAYCVRSFFDNYLKTAGASRLKLASPLYPEVEIPAMDGFRRP